MNPYALEYCTPKSRLHGTGQFAKRPSMTLYSGPVPENEPCRRQCARVVSDSELEQHAVGLVQ